MGYTLTIGNARPAKPDADDTGYRWEIAPLAAPVPDAPRHPNDTNPGAPFRWPSYSAWADFTRATGLDDLFYSRDGGLLASHPGIARLTAAHRATIDAALVAYRAAHPGAVAGFSADYGDTDPASLVNAQLARLEWLAFWVGWALGNCEHPAFGNS